MRSICVLDEKNREITLTRFAQKLQAALGSRVVLMTDENPATQPLAETLQNAFVAGGATVFLLPGGFESRIVSVSRQLAADGAVYLSCDPVCRMSVYGANGRSLTGEEEQRIAQAAPAVSAAPGSAVLLPQNEAYEALARRIGETFENVAVSFSSPNEALQRFTRQIAIRLGAVARNRPQFFISRSGLRAAAEDERGRVFSHERLLDLCCACELREGRALDVPFSSSFALMEPARRNGAVLTRSFAGGCEPWQTDGVMLALRLARHMSRSGLSLAALFDRMTLPAERRTIVVFDGSLDRLADRIACEEAVSSGDGLLYLKRPTAEAVLTRRRNGKRCCLEVQACSAEIAQAVCEELEQAILTYSDN